MKIPELTNGLKHHESGQINKAIECYLNALNKDFDNTEVLHYLGTALFQMGYNGAGANILSMAAQRDPKNIDSIINLGACYMKEWKHRGAEEIWRIAIAQMEKKGAAATDISGVLSNIAGLYVHDGEYDKALAIYREALRLDPSNVHALGNQGLANLAVGNWRQGWIGYEHHLALNTRRRRAYGTVPEWKGEPINDKTIVVYGEQGVGDEIMFASMIHDLNRIAGKVIFDCHPRLVSVFKRSFGIDCYGTRKTSDCPWLEGVKPDYAIAVGSLGKFYRNEAADFIGAPYLVPKSGKIRQRGSSERWKIGLSWKGGTKGTGEHARSFPLETYAPLISALPEADWYSLQYHQDAARETAELMEKTGLFVRHLPSAVHAFDYDETVSAVANLDLVITVPTTVLHTAGALGVPCWVLVQKEAAWRETGNMPGRGEAMPWYRSVRLFHKTTDEWMPLILKVMHELVGYTGVHRAEPPAACAAA